MVKQLKEAHEVEQLSKNIMEAKIKVLDHAIETAADREKAIKKQNETDSKIEQQRVCKAKEEADERVIKA